MSGIYGYTFRTADASVLTDALGGLEYWTRKYGRQAHGQEQMGLSAIGCHIQHFTERFPYGGPVLELEGYKAVADALLFNRDELMAELGLSADTPISDEELLLRFVLNQGFDALVRVNGDFSCALFDTRTKEWILFRDHMGVRPLYYYLDERVFAFSSDERGLAALPDADLSIDEMMLYRRFIIAKSLYAVETDFLKILCVRPGSIARVRMTEDGFDLRTQIYWQPHRKKIRFRTDEEYRQELRRLVTDAVHRRCDAIDGILGGELSGGLDSGVIDILINRHGRDARFFSWSNDPSERPLLEGRDERKVVLAICKQENIHCRFNNREDRYAYHLKREYVQQPFLNTTPIGVGSNYLHTQGARVIFSGHTGDEGVSHRARRMELFHHREYISYFKLYWLDLKGKPLRLLRAIRAGLHDAHQYYSNVDRSGENLSFYPDVLNDDFCRRMHSQYENRKFTFQFDPVNYIRQGGSRARFDITACYGAITDTQYLFPYADHRVMEFALSIPRRLYVNQTETRLIFRETFGELMPKELSEVAYKCTASNMNRTRDDNYDQDFQENLDKILADLDREKWGAILDFDAIAALKPAAPGIDTTLMTMKLSHLIRCIAIGRMQTDSKKWREFDERDKKTV